MKIVNLPAICVIPGDMLTQADKQVSLVVSKLEVDRRNTFWESNSGAWFVFLCAGQLKRFFFRYNSTTFSCIKEDDACEHVGACACANKINTE